MLQKCVNPNKVLGDVTDLEKTFKPGEFDFVDNGSIALLRNPDEVKRSLLQAHRVLQPDGLIELITEGKRFMDSFYEGLEQFGFEILSEKHEGFAVGNRMFQRLKKQFGEHYAESYSNKLSQTHYILARKKDEPADVEAKKFWFETIAPDELSLASPAVRADFEKLETGFTPVPFKTRWFRRPKKPTKNRPALPGEIPGLRGDAKATIED
jgi:SAM-dependent methyltransferase